MDHDFESRLDELSEDGQGRRDFIKKAGAVAWVVPAMQVVNMASAAAGGEATGSVVDTTRPPSGGGCSTGYVYIKVEAYWHCNEEPNGAVVNNDDEHECRDGYWTWTRNEKGCIQEFDYHVDPRQHDLPIWIADGSDMYRAGIGHEIRGCRIVKAKTYMGDRCVDGEINASGTKAGFSVRRPEADGDERPPMPRGLRHMEFLLKCCRDHMDMKD